jgi:hypothetical protein
MTKRLGLLAAFLLAGCTIQPDDPSTTTTFGGGAGNGPPPPNTGGFGGSFGTGGSVGGAAGTKGGAVVLACDPLAPPKGNVIKVTPSQTADLPSIIADAAPGTTISFGEGIYSPVPRLTVKAAGVSLRSEFGNGAAVVLDGAYATDEIVVVSASNVTVADLTIKHAVNHLIHVSPPEGGPDVTGVRLYRLRLDDAGEQFVKVNPNGGRTFWVDGGSLECSALTLSADGRPHVVSLPDLPCYTGGIDAHSALGWRVRRNRFEGFWCPIGLSEHAIHFWNSSRDTITENNVIVNSARGIGYGLGETGAVRDYLDNPYPTAGFVGHYNGIIRNNVIFADIMGFDTGIALEQSRGTRVFHNTIFSTNTSTTFFFSSIDYRFSNTTGGEIRNNLVHRISMRDGAGGSVDHNLENVPALYFLNPTTLDFHLSSTAVNAVDRGVVLPDTGVDMDGRSRGPLPDLGAYERFP